MAFIRPVLGIGQYFGNTVLRGVNTYVSSDNFIDGFGIEIQFFSFGENFIGGIGTTYDNAPHLQLNIQELKNGGMQSATITTSRKPDIPFFNGMIVKIFVYNNLFFTGELVYIPEQDDRKTVFEYTVKGYSGYLEKVIVNELYENRTVDFILNDIMSNYIDGATPIRYSPAEIRPPDVTLTKFEVNDKSARKAIEDLLQIVNENYSQDQYVYGVDADRFFYFRKIDNDLKYGFFEGYQFQNPEIERNDDKLVNRILIYRAVEKSDQIEYIDTIEDTESQGLYGIREDRLVISEFFDADTARSFAKAKVDRFRAPVTSVKINSLNIDPEKYTISKYAINNKIDNYTEIVSECDSLTIWNLDNISATTAAIETTIVLTGKKSFKFELSNGSAGEYIEYTLEDSIENPQILSLFVNQNPLGASFNITVFDDEGISVDISTACLLTEDGFELLTEDGDSICLETANSGFDVILVDNWQKQSFNISAVTNIAKIRITFTSDSNITLYIDRIECQYRGYKQSILIPEKINYRMTTQSFLCNMELGESFPNAIDEIRDLKDSNNNLFNIFTKQG